MIEIKTLTIQDLREAEASLWDAKVSITWYGKQVIQINNKSFSLCELTEKMLEISSFAKTIAASERLPGFEILRNIKHLSRNAEQQLTAKNYLTLFTRAILWIQHHTLDIILPQWRTDHIETMRQKAKENFRSYDLNFCKQEYPEDEDVSNESKDTIQVDLYWIRKKAHEQLLLQPAIEQKKSTEVIKEITKWCDDNKHCKAPARSFLWDLLQLDDTDFSTKESLIFIMSQIPHFVEKACSKSAFTSIASTLWRWADDEEDFQKQLEEAFQTENSLLNQSLNLAKHCASVNDFPGALSALKKAAEVLRQIECPYHADEIQNAYASEETITHGLVQDVRLVSYHKVLSPHPYKVEIILKDGRKSMRDIGAFEFKNLLNIFPDNFFGYNGRPKPGEYEYLVRNNPHLMKTCSVHLSEIKNNEDLPPQDFFNITKFLSSAFDPAITIETKSNEFYTA
jgi:hypothetical protein